MLTQTRYQRVAKSAYQLPSGAGGEMRTEQEIVVPSQTDKVVIDLSSGTNTVSDAGNRGWFLKRDYNLYSTDPNFLYNSSGASEEWFEGYTHPGSGGGASNRWCYLLSNGEFYQWSGVGVTGTLLAKLDMVFWRKPTELIATSSYSDDDMVNFLKNRQGFNYANTGTNYDYNCGGAQEKWVRGSSSSWYFIKPDGSLWLWDGTASSASGTLWANLSVAYYNDPQLLPNPYAAPSVTISNGQLIVDPAAGYVGEWFVELKNVTGGVATKTLYRFGFTDAGGLGVNWASEKVSTTGYTYDSAEHVTADGNTTVTQDANGNRNNAFGKRVSPHEPLVT